MKIAVTGANGKLGSAILINLKELAKDHTIIGFARTPSKVSISDIEVRKGDYDCKVGFLEGLNDVDVLLLLSGMDQPEKRIVQHSNIIDAAKECGVKKVVYTSIIGNAIETSFGPVVSSNRKTEDYLKASGLNWSIGRNGLYIEPDLEYVDRYIKEGGIINCAGEGLTSYTSRDELGFAYSMLLLDENTNNKTFNLASDSITQLQLAEQINNKFGTTLSYKEVSVEEYTKSRSEALGPFLGGIIAGIYDGINKGHFDVKSDFHEATGRAHKSITQIVNEFK